MVVAPVARAPFHMDWAPKPWDDASVPVWRPIPQDICVRIEKAVDALMGSADTGTESILIPLPLVVGNPGEIPRSYFVVVSRMGAGHICINQLGVDFQSGTGHINRTRPVRAPDYIMQRYLGVLFSHGMQSDEFLNSLFWGVLSNLWGRIAESIALRDQPALPLMEEDTLQVEERLLFNHVRLVLRSEIMRPLSDLASVVIPVENSGMEFMFFARIGVAKVNSVLIRIPRYAGRTATQGALMFKFVNLFEQAFPGWSFPCVPLTAHGLFDLIQIPVREHYTRKIQNVVHAALRAPLLRMLAKVLSPRAINQKCLFAEIGKDLLLRIVAIVQEDPQWAYP